jgi:hypothetical protein
MKYLKMLGLAAIAAMGVMAFLGASSASATVLCEVTPAAGTDCPAASVVAAGTSLDFSVEAGHPALLTGPFGEVVDSCANGTVKGPTTNTGSTTETVKGTIESLTWENCTHPTSTKANGSLEIHWISGTDNGTVTSTGSTVEIKEVEIPFIGKVNCQYSTNATDIGTLTGRTATGGDPTFDIQASLSSENGCPKGTWEGSYVYTGTTTFDVANG